MHDSPIRRKHLPYPKDFLPTQKGGERGEGLTAGKRFAVSQDYQIEANAIRKYQPSIEDPPSNEPNNDKLPLLASPEITQEHPLLPHASRPLPSLDYELLKKPRFSLNPSEEISEGDPQSHASPGTIRKQLENRQAPLPPADPCRIDLLQGGGSARLDSVIRFQADGEKQWLQSEQDLLRRFKEERMRRSSAQELPAVGKNSREGRRGSLGQTRMALSRREGRERERDEETDLPRFDQSVVNRLKEEINHLARSRKAKLPDYRQDYQQPPQQSQLREKDRIPIGPARPLPEFEVSYRCSLSQLRDLYNKARALPEWRLSVKIPKLFTEKLLFRGQEREEVEEAARAALGELRIPVDNLSIKRYTNCTLVVARSVCLIWHFDGRRYLGGWQTEYLDEGCKHGLGLDWTPNRHVYYGEFQKNRREGLGAFKDRSQQPFIGYWKNGRPLDTLEQGRAQTSSSEEDQYV